MFLSLKDERTLYDFHIARCFPWYPRKCQQMAIIVDFPTFLRSCSLYVFDLMTRLGHTREFGKYPMPISDFLSRLRSMFYHSDFMYSVILVGDTFDSIGQRCKLLIPCGLSCVDIFNHIYVIHRKRVISLSMREMHYPFLVLKKHYVHFWFACGPKTYPC